MHKPILFFTRLLSFGLILFAAPCALAGDAPSAPPGGAYAFKALLDDGTQVEITLTKTGAELGIIKEVRWKKGKNPARDKPVYNETSDLYGIRVSRDGRKIFSKASEPLRDPTVTFTISDAAAPRPTVTVIIKGTVLGVADRETTYLVTAPARQGLLDFLRWAKFPEMAAAG